MSDFTRGTGFQPVASRGNDASRQAPDEWVATQKVAATVRATGRKYKPVPGESPLTCYDLAPKLYAIRKEVSRIQAEIVKIEASKPKNRHQRRAKVAQLRDLRHQIDSMPEK